MRRFLLAVQFLTIIPVMIRGGVTQKDLGRSMGYFPLTGLLIAGLLCLIYYCTSVLCPQARAALLAALGVIVTGGVHLDGWADTCDGFYGQRSKEDRLMIMRDSSVGAMGAAGIVILLLLKYSFYLNADPDQILKLIIMMCVGSRWTQMFACISAPYARKEGKALAYIEYLSKRSVFVNAVLICVLFFFLAGIKGLVIFAVTLIYSLLFIRVSLAKIQGITGDVIGALSESVEVVVLIAGSVVL